MKRSERGAPAPPDYSPLLRALMYLDECLKRGVVVGIFEGSMEVSDEDLERAMRNVRHQLELTTESMERCARALTRATQLPGAPLLQ